jgi:dTDP-4-dehydrorhamnose reductase
MTRWLITGARGQLGTDLQRVLEGADVVTLSRTDLDVTDADAVAKTVADLAPTVVINAAAYTAVDAAEEDEEGARVGNVTYPAALAAVSARLGARFVHVSTDYVFAGDATTPYEVDDPTGPQSVYGATKLEGEQRVREACPDAYVVRTAWVYGATGSNFVKTMARLEQSKETLDVVDDQRGSPTWSADLARGLVVLADSDAPAGIYHCTNAGETTWCGLARAVFEEIGADPARVKPTTSAAYVRPAPRPSYSVLSGTAWANAGLPPLPHWREALREAFRTAGPALRPS